MEGTPRVMSSKKENTFWSKMLHRVSILTKDPRDGIAGPGASGGLAQMSEMMIGLRLPLEDHLENKK